MRRFAFALFLVALSTTAFSGTLINVKQWKSSEGGNDHWYGIFDENWWRSVASEKVSALPIPAEIVASGISTPGYLATILSAEENNFIRDSILGGPLTSWSLYDFFWLGGRESKVTDEFGWDTHEAVVYTNWGDSEPNNHLETALGMWGYQTQYHGAPAGLWNDSSEDTLLVKITSMAMVAASIVEWGPLEGALVPPIPDFPEVYRLQQWKVADGGNNHWYGIYTKNQSIDGIQNIQVSPESIAGTGLTKPHYLLTITSGAENEFVSTRVLDTKYPFANKPYYWTGGERTTIYHNPVGFTHKWYWNTGEPFSFTNWTAGQPTADGGSFFLIMTQNIYEKFTAEGSYTLTSATEWRPLADAYDYNKYWSILEWGNPFCGDVDNNQKTNINDLTSFVRYLFAGGTLAAPGNADASGDGSVNIGDIAKMAQYLFSSGGPLACAEW